MTGIQMHPANLTIVAPSRALVSDIEAGTVDIERLNAAVARLSAMGWNVSEAANVRCNVERFAGTDAERACGFESAMNDCECDLVMSLRGGYGAARLLPLIDWNGLRESKAIFVGLSDTTAMNAALFAKAGLASWQGPTAASFSRDNRLRDARFRAALEHPHYRLQLPVTGDTVCEEGMLWGGNLSILVSLLSTEYFPTVEGGIFYIEDIAEPAWRLERMLLQLAQAGVLGRQKAIVVGDTTGADKACGAGDAHYGRKECLDYIRRLTGLPVIEGLPFGHIPDTLMMPFGVRAQVQSLEGVLTIDCENAPVPACTAWSEAPKTLTWWQ